MLLFLDSFAYYNVLTEKWTTAGSGQIDLTVGSGTSITRTYSPTTTNTVWPIAPAKPTYTFVGEEDN